MSLGVQNSIHKDKKLSLNPDPKRKENARHSGTRIIFNFWISYFFDINVYVVWYDFRYDFLEFIAGFI